MVKPKKQAKPGLSTGDASILTFFKRPSDQRSSPEAVILLSDEDTKDERPDNIKMPKPSRREALKTLKRVSNKRKRVSTSRLEANGEESPDDVPSAQKENTKVQRKRPRKPSAATTTSSGNDQQVAEENSEVRGQDGSALTTASDTVLEALSGAPHSSTSHRSLNEESKKCAPAPRSRRVTRYAESNFPISGWQHVGYMSEDAQTGSYAHPIADSRRTDVRATAQPCQMTSDPSEAADERHFVTIEKVGQKVMKKTIRSWNNEAKKVFDSAVARSNNEVQGSAALADQFRPRTRADFFANLECVNELYEWFAAWKKKLHRDPPTKEPSKKRNRTDGDESDEDYVCEHRSLPNPLVLSGPLGSGKTSMAHSIAHDSGFKIIELSVGDKRDASALKQKISGALSSYYVNNQSADIRSMFQPKTQDGKKPSDCSKHTAIFLDDVDVVYTSDDRFWTTLKSLCEESKIPMLLACTDREAVENSLCETPALEDYRVLTLLKPSTSQFTTFLQPWILGHSGFVLDSDTAKKIAETHCSDVRRTMCELHYQLLGISKLEFRPGSTREAPSDAVNCPRIPFLAELDAVLGASPRDTVAWTATDVTDLDFAGPNTDKQDQLKDQLREILNDCASSAGSARAELPVNKAVVNCRLRSVPRDMHPLRAVAMDYLPAMFAMNKAYQQKTKLSRRSIHPFAAVDYATGTAIDVRGHLIGSLPGYGLL